ncbi:MAG: hypothetical protein KF708_21430 [Pirellulales bacterium]|nr:hypothetical protein [Pirellulales bacterium]
MQTVGQAYRAAGVRQIILAHGTFVGTDALGMLADLARIFPAASQTLREVIKKLVDQTLGETGNYTEEFARLFERSLAGDDPAATIPVRLFHWSSENSHLGRAEAAVRLIDELAALNLPADAHVLLWGHSHAGNVFAIVSQLLARDRQTVEAFFTAAKPFYRWPILGTIDLPQWERVRQWLLRRYDHSPSEPPPFPQLDLVTFGTPIRYGWNESGYTQLMHVVHHRPQPGVPPYRTTFPPTLDEVLAAEQGDYVQQFGIAGTNLMPSLLAWRTWWADWRLDRLLEGAVSPRDLIARLRSGRRVPDVGTTLLVNYGPMPGDITQHHAGHAIYTRREWLLFHAEEVAKVFYGL